MSANVKSAVRVLRVLEYFDGVRRPAGVTEVARALKFPASSTTGLLRSLVDLDYLVQDANRMYRPTPRVTLLGSWIDPQLAPDGPVISMMNELGAATGEAIILAIPSGITVRYIHVVPATKSMRLHVGPGDVRPMAFSGIGRLFLSQMGDDDVRKLIFRHNALQQDDAQRLSYPALRRDIEGIRAAGYSVSLDRISQGAGLVCLPLPSRPDAGRMGVAVAGLSSTIRSNSEMIAGLIADAIRRHLGPNGARSKSSRSLVQKASVS